MNRSIPTGTDVQFINVEQISPLISKCEIKVLYTGLNRNNTFIDKETAERIAQTLPGTPIVGFYDEDKKDFLEHEKDLVIDEKGISFNSTTVPYGFIPLYPEIYWRPFEDKDGVLREYLVVTGYLWTGRYPELKNVITVGNHHSMELDPDTLDVEWTKDSNNDTEYFKVNDATFSALCILGRDIEPCFEGSSIKKPSLYSLKENFKEMLTIFMLDVDKALNPEGGNKMILNNNDIDSTVEDNVVEDNIDNGVVEDNEVIVDTVEGSESEGDFAKKKKKDEDEDDNSDDSRDEDNDDAKDEDDEDEDDKKKKKKTKYNLDEVVEYSELLEKYNKLSEDFALIEEELNKIKPEYSLLKTEHEAAVLKAKDDMIGSFYMLSDEDKKDVIENKANYSLDEIESKLSVICVRKKVNFALDDTEKSEDNTDDPIATYNLDSSSSSGAGAPAWLRSVKEVRNRR